ATLFLHHPEFKGEYTKIQGKKMLKAFPYFVKGLEELHFSGKVLEYVSKDAYLDGVETIMDDSMREATKSFRREDIDGLGLLIGYQQGVFEQNPYERREDFAIT